MMQERAEESTTDADQALFMLRKDRWAGQVIERGRRPVVPSFDLPAASHDYDGTFFQVAATTGVESKLYWGAVSAAGAPEWIEVATGTP